MALVPHEVLGRMADTLRHDIGPAVDEPFAKTQAFMASVVLTKLAGELRASKADAEAAARDRDATVAALRSRLGDGAPPVVGAAIDALAGDGADRTWNRLVESLDACRDELGPQPFEELLGIVRTALRARLDRALAWSS